MSVYVHILLGKKTKTMKEHKEFLVKITENVFIHNEVEITPTNLIRIS